MRKRDHEDLLRNIDEFIRQSMDTVKTKLDIPLHSQQQIKDKGKILEEIDNQEHLG